MQGVPRQQTSRRQQKTKSKKRKYASQPRFGRNKKELRDILPPMELPLSRIKESQPISVFQKKVSHKDLNRSLSASSNNSRRSFRATRKRPSYDG